MLIEEHVGAVSVSLALVTAELGPGGKRHAVDSRSSRLVGAARVSPVKAAPGQ